MKQLAGEYRESGALCRCRAAALERELRHRQHTGINAMETMRLRRRIGMLRSMARDCAAISAYLGRYYERRAEHERCI